MHPSRELIDALYVDEILRARRMDPQRKLLAPARLYEYTRGITLAALRNEHPPATEEELRELFRQRLRIGRQLQGRRDWPGNSADRGPASSE